MFEMEDDITESTDDQIKYNMDMYLSYICECVDAPHLLQHLDYYTSVQRAELIKLSRTSPVEASSKAFRVLMNDDTPGVFTALLQSFIDVYPRVIKLLTGDVVRCDANYRKIITHFTPEIIKQIQPMELLPYLRQYDVLTDEDVEETMAEERNFGSIRAAWIIVLNIHRHIEDWFKCFLMSLMETDREELAVTLDPDMVEKIKIQREFASVNRCSELAEEEIGCDVVKENVQEFYYEALDSTKVLNSPSPIQITTKLQSSFSDGNALVESGKSDSNVNIVGSCKTELYDEKVLYFQHDCFGGIDGATGTAAADLTDLKIVRAVGNGAIGGDTDDTDDADEDDVTALKQICRSHTNDDNTTLNQLSRSGDNDAGANLTVLKQVVRSGDNDGPALKQVVRSDNEGNALVSVLKQVVRPDDNDGDADMSALKQVVKSDDTDGDTEFITTVKMVATQGDNDACEITDNESADSNIDDDLVDFNDLDEVLSEIAATTTRNNIVTDVNNITGSTEHTIDLRGYQEKLSRKGCEGENVIIMAPTNSGKTKVACQIIFSYFERCKLQNKEGKAAFIVDKEELAFQQGKVFEVELPGYRTKVVTGDVQQNKNQNLKDYVHRRDILVVTAQVLLNCLKAKELRGLDIFDILVFDECHHTDKKHPYREIMDIYFEVKLDKHAYIEMPQIVGLTASIGVGGKLDRNIALENMKQIAANLDTYALCTIDGIEDREEMKDFINEPEESIIGVPRRKTERFYEDILENVEKIDTFMMKNQSIDNLEGDDLLMKAISRVPTVSTGTCQFQSWLSDFRQGLTALKSNEARQVLSPCWCYIERYHQAVMLYNDARIQDALRLLESFVYERRRADYNNEADEFLLTIFDNLISNSYSTEPENPKLLKLKEILVDTMIGNKSARGIIFVKTREIAKILKQWMHATEELKPLNANTFLGQVVSLSEEGMTKSKQRDVLALFKNGRYKIIIATTVAEEGLDIAACNLVIKYEHVTEEKARVQCRGRARADHSRYYVITEIGSWIIEKEEYNARCEKLMEELVPDLKNYMEQNRNRWEDEILEMQRNAKAMKELQLTERQAGRTDVIAYLHCGNCGSMICCSDDIKKICGMHHIVINGDILTRIVLKPSLEPKHLDKRNDIAMGGNVYCSNKNCIFKYELGGIIQYCKIDFPVLKIKQFAVKDIDGNLLPSARQWNKVCFKIESIDMTDMKFIIRQRSLAQ